MPPLVTVITPTWRRHDVLLGRCVPSVQEQNYRGIEHLIVSDGPDPELAGAELPANVRLIQLDDHDPQAQWGHRARLRGIGEASGQVLAWLDDDDSWRPRHLAVLVPAVTVMPVPGFAYSRAMMHSAGGKTFRIGDGPLAFGRIAPACMVVHDRQILDLETWRSGEADWDLVQRWVERGVPCASVDEVTVDYYPHREDLDAQVPVAFRPLRPAIRE